MVEEDAGACLREEGFSASQVLWYIQRLRNPPGTDLGTGTDTGFGIVETAIITHDTKLDSPAEVHDPFANEAERSAFWSAEQECRSRALDQFNEFLILGRPNAPVQVDDPELQAALAWYGSTRQEIEELVQSDPSVEKAHHEWVDCMANLGHQVASKEQMLADLRRKADELVSSLPDVPDSLDEVSDHSDGELREFLNKERALARATEECDRPILLAEREARHRIESEYATVHEDRLSLVQDHLSELFQKLQGVLDD